MSHTRTLDTYIIFTKQGKGLKEVIGPLFYNELHQIKAAHFATKKAHIVEEAAFASMYPKQYRIHIHEQWYNKLYCYFTCNYHWTGSVTVSTTDRCIIGSWFSLFQLEDNKGKFFQLNLHINHNRFYAAKLKEDLYDMNLMPLINGDEYFQDKEERIFTGSNAISRYLATEMITHMCLT